MSDASFPLKIVAESEMTPEMDAAVRECLCACFPADAEVFFRTRAWHGSAPQYSVVFFEGGRVVGHVGIVVREVLAGEERIRIAGIQNMAIRPEGRKTGLGAALMTAAMEEAARRKIGFGVLFCVPELERYYARFGWVRHDVEVRMDFAGEENVPIPGKNICMVKALTPRLFPPGGLHLQGADW